MRVRDSLRGPHRRCRATRRSATRLCLLLGWWWRKETPAHNARGRPHTGLGLPSRSLFLLLGTRGPIRFLLRGWSEDFAAVAFMAGTLGVRFLSMTARADGFRSEGGARADKA